MIAASFLFASMGVCVKLASAHYAAGEIVFYRALMGALLMSAFARSRGISLRTSMPAMHFWRSLSGVLALSLWFYAIGGLPLPTAMTLNYMSSVWMALFLIGGAVLFGATRVDARLVAAVLLGFAGVALVLRPTIAQNQTWAGFSGLVSGLLSALAYLQITALGRAGEPEPRIVFYFSLGGVVVGTLTMLATGMHTHTLQGIVLLVAVGVLASVAQLMMTRAYRIGRPLVNASLQYLGIAFSFAYGVVLFDDPLPWAAVAGIALIVTAGLMATRLSAEKAPNLPPHSTLEP